MGGDSCVSANGVVWRSASPKVFVVGNFVIGWSGDMAFGSLCRYQVDWSKRLSADVDTYMHVMLPAEIRETCRRQGVELPDGQALIGVCGALYDLNSDQTGVVCSRIAEPYGTVGSGADVALGALFALRDRGPTVRIRKALEAAEAHCEGVRGPFHLVSA